jgi:hypothetical protein
LVNFLRLSSNIEIYLCLKAIFTYLHQISTTNPTDFSNTSLDFHSARAVMLDADRSWLQEILAPFRTGETPPRLLIENIHRLNRICLAHLCPTSPSLDGPLVIVGNLHGSLSNFNAILDRYTIDHTYVILGNFVGVGDQSIELAFLLLLLRVLYPDHFVLLRGAQECRYSNRHEPFFQSCLRRYGLPVWQEFNSSFQQLPIAAFVNGQILCTPAGLSPRIECREEVDAPIGEIAETGIPYDLLFSEINPEPSKAEWPDSKDQRSFAFGRPEAEAVCKLLAVTTVVFGTKSIAAWDGEPAIRETNVGIEPFGNDGDFHFWRVFSASKTREGVPCEAVVLEVHPSGGEVIPVIITPAG